MKIKWEEASIAMCALDAFVMLIISISIIRLRWYEKATCEDMKQGRLRVEDFSVIIPKIPLEQKDYSNSPDLLQAMLAVHLEEITAHELQ